MKKRIYFTGGQFIFLIVSMSIISILAFLLGIEVGKLLKAAEAPLKEVTTSVKPNVKISLENYSTILKKQEKQTVDSGKKEDVMQQSANKTPSNQELNRTTNSEEKTFIQVGAFKEKASYLSAEKRLHSLGYKTKVVTGKLFRLLVIVDSKENAETVLKRLEKDGIKGFIVKND